MKTVLASRVSFTLSHFENFFTHHTNGSIVKQQILYFFAITFGFKLSFALKLGLKWGVIDPKKYVPPMCY